MGRCTARGKKPRPRRRARRSRDGRRGGAQGLRGRITRASRVGPRQSRLAPPSPPRLLTRPTPRLPLWGYRIQMSLAPPCASFSAVTPPTRPRSSCHRLSLLRAPPRPTSSTGALFLTTALLASPLSAVACYPPPHLFCSCPCPHYQASGATAFRGCLTPHAPPPLLILPAPQPRLFHHR